MTSPEHPLDLDCLHLEMVADALGDLASAEQDRQTAQIDEAVAGCHLEAANTPAQRLEALDLAWTALARETIAVGKKMIARKNLALLMPD